MSLLELNIAVAVLKSLFATLLFFIAIVAMKDEKSPVGTDALLRIGGMIFIALLITQIPNDILTILFGP